MQRSIWTALATIILLGGCGGGDGGGGTVAEANPPVAGPTPAPSPTPPASNNAPQIDVVERVEVREGSTLIIDRVSASDDDGDALSFAVSGPDAAFFAPANATPDDPDADGTVSTALNGSGLDFEVPGDADGDGIYSVTLTVSDGTDSASQAVEIVVNDARFETVFAFETIASGLQQPLQTVGLPGSDTEYVLLQKGGLVLYENSGLTPGSDFSDIALDLRGTISTDGERGLLGFAFSPTFETDRSVYVNVTNPGGATEIRRYRMFTNRSDQIDPSTMEVIIRVPQPFSNHNAGWLGFASDGTLLIPMGDGGGANDPQGNAQDPFRLLGKVLRLDVTSGDGFPDDDNRNFTIPPDNPFADGVNGDPEVFALGLRNPYRAYYDSVTDALYIADVGQDAREEISKLTLNDGGVNFGWPLFEGRLPNTGSDPTGLTLPIAEIAHGFEPGRGRSITGGFVTSVAMDDPSMPPESYFIFGDFLVGNLWSLDLQKIPDGGLDAATFEALDPAGPVRRLGGFGQLTDVSALAGGGIVMTQIDGTVIVGRPAPASTSGD